MTTTEDKLREFLNELNGEDEDFARMIIKLQEKMISTFSIPVCEFEQSLYEDSIKTLKKNPSKSFNKLIQSLVNGVAINIILNSQNFNKAEFESQLNNMYEQYIELEEEDNKKKKNE